MNNMFLKPLWDAANTSLSAVCICISMCTQYCSKHRGLKYPEENETDAPSMNSTCFQCYERNILQDYACNTTPQDEIT